MARTRLRPRRLLLEARAAAWVLTLAGLAVAPLWVSILRDVLGVGCQNLAMAGDNAHVCQDGIGYIGVGLQFFVFSLVVSVALILTQWRFGKNASSSTWHLHWVPFGLFVALCAALAEAAKSGAGVVAGATAPLGALAIATMFLALGLAIARWTLASRAAHVVAFLAFVAAALMDYRVAPIAILGVAIALTSALDSAHLLTLRTAEPEPRHMLTAKG